MSPLPPEHAVSPAPVNPLRLSAAAVALAAAAALGVGSVAAAPAHQPTGPAGRGAQQMAVAGTPLFPFVRRNSLRRVVLDVPSISMTRTGSVIRLNLKNVEPRFKAVTTRNANVRQRTGAWVLPHYWQAAFGFNPTVSLSYTVAGRRRTHVLRGGVLPRYSNGNLGLQFIDGNENHQVFARMRPSAARDVQVTLLPTPAGSSTVNFKPGSYDPGMKAQKSEAQSADGNDGAPYPAPGANQPFTLPYMQGLGPPWVPILSATGQTASACVQYPPASGLKGNTSTSGAIYVYQTSAQAQQALNIGGSISGTVGKVSADLSAAYSSNKSQSTSSVYAVAIVNYQGGFVDLGGGTTPLLTGSYSTQAQKATTLSAALTFMSQCGDSYPATYNVGATWLSVLEIKTASQSSATNLAVNLDAKYRDYSGAVDFSNDVQKNSSSAQVFEHDQCWGPSDCFGINGFATAAGTDTTTALNQFTANFNAMLHGLPSSCTAGQCITSVGYKPISQLTSGSAVTALSQAAWSVFGVSQNLNAWHSQYQAIVAAASPTGDGNDQASPYASTITGLNAQANYCSLYGLPNSACYNRYDQCWSAAARVTSYLNAPCLPSAFTSNGLAGTTDPFVLSGTTEANLAQ